MPIFSVESVGMEATESNGQARGGFLASTYVVRECYSAQQYICTKFAYLYT